jgi:hypothetical protein
VRQASRWVKRSARASSSWITCPRRRAMRACVTR